MHKLGLLREILSYGARVHSLQGYIPSGRSVLDIDYRHIHPELFGLGVHRGT